MPNLGSDACNIWGNPEEPDITSNTLSTTFVSIKYHTWSNAIISEKQRYFAEKNSVKPNSDIGLISF